MPSALRCIKWQSARPAVEVAHKSPKKALTMSVGASKSLRVQKE
jgi:hypothetical protein